MMGSWKVGAQLSTSHSSPDSLDPLGMLETVRSVQEAIDLDLLILGFREAPATFREFCGLRRPVHDTALWYSALSDIEGMEDSDLVVNWLGERSRGWGAWPKKPAEWRRRSASRARTIRLCARRRSGGFANSSHDMLSLASFWTRSAFLRPRTASMKCSPAFATTAGTRRSALISISTLSSKSSRVAPSTHARREPKQAAPKPPRGSMRCLWAVPSFRTLSAFEPIASLRSSPSSPKRRGGWGGRCRSTCSRLASPRWWAKTWVPQKAL
jgi:hypothetical protein